MAEAVARGEVDAALIRREPGESGLKFAPLLKEPLLVFMPSDHRLIHLNLIDPMELAGETFLEISSTARFFRLF